MNTFLLALVFSLFSSNSFAQYYDGCYKLSNYGKRDVWICLNEIKQDRLHDQSANLAVFSNPTSLKTCHNELQVKFDRNVFQFLDKREEEILSLSVRKVELGRKRGNAIFDSYHYRLDQLSPSEVQPLLKTMYEGCSGQHRRWR
jgi:hypothetical protein